MAYVVKCDICGATYTPYSVDIADEYITSIMFAYHEPTDDYMSRPETLTDLCPECMKALDLFLDTRRKMAHLDAGKEDDTE